MRIITNLLFYLRPLKTRQLHVDVSPLLENYTVQKFLHALPKNKKVLDEFGRIADLIKKRQQMENELAALHTLKEDDKEMLDMINDEKLKFTESINFINRDILNELAPVSDVDRDVVVEVTAGVGGKEAMHFAGELFEMYVKYCSYKRWQCEVQEMDVPETGGIRHASVFVCGREASASLKQESGVHRVQRVPATEKSGRIHTSTVTVAVLPQPHDFEVVIDEKDLKMETKTSSGAGGQHVNKTESCVRLTHLPTGITIENQTDRSQLQNKKLALQRLRSKLYQMEVEGFLNKTQSSRKEQGGQPLDQLISQLQLYHHQQNLLRYINDNLTVKVDKDR